MRLSRIGLVVALALAPLVARADEDTVTVGDVAFQRNGPCVTLSNAKVARGWSTDDRTCAFVLPGVPQPILGYLQVGEERPWVLREVFEFRLVIDGVTLDARDFLITDMVPASLPHGIQVTFRYELAPRYYAPVTDPLPSGALVLERRVTLHEGSTVFEIDNTLLNQTPAPLRLTSARLDQLFSDNLGTLEIAAYSGGSDWRDDFRRTSTMSTTPGCEPVVGEILQRCATDVDSEGEVLRVGDGAGRGWFHVSERRGGPASRAGFVPFGTGTLATTWVGVDYPRDLLDAGPILTSPPNYNRIENPAYPVPIRGRVIPPSSSFHVGRVATGVYTGGAQAAAVGYGNYLARYRQPRFARQVMLNSFHPWGRGSDYTDATMRAQADVAEQLGIDTIILDDQWQGGPGGESGDWNWDRSSVDGDPARFPDADGDGVTDFVEYIRAKGLKLGLWLTPAEFHPSSAAFAEHPEWSCVPIGTAASRYPDEAGFGVWDFTNADLRSYITSVVDRLIAQDGATYFKFDFQVWVDCPPHDYNDYEDAFVGWVDELQVAHPEVTFQFDETNDQRMWAFSSAARGPSWFDNYHAHVLPSGTIVTRPAQLLHDVWMAAPWIPPSVLGVGTFDGTLSAYDPSFLLAAACLTHWTFWTDLTALSSQVRAEATWWIDWYHEHAEVLSGAAYSLTGDDPRDGGAPAAFQIGGHVFAFRQAGAPPTITVQASPGTFTLTNVRDGTVLGPYQTGDAITAPLEAPNQAALYRIDPV